MVKTYIKVVLSSEGASPKKVIECMRSAGAVPIVGDYDFEIMIADDERLFDKLEEIHNLLKGADVRYTVTTYADVDSSSSGGRPPFIRYIDQKPIELKKSLYKGKLQRWREMGLDVSELEKLLETDLEKFKEASKDFLKTHLNRMTVVKDQHLPESKIDGEVLALIDENGKTIAEIVSVTGYFEDQVVLSLGRLISSGGVRMEKSDDKEMYCIVPPPAPVSPAESPSKGIELTEAENDEEAEDRILEVITEEGLSTKELVRAAKLPREQFMRAFSSLLKKGEIVKQRRGKREYYTRTQ